jgi:isopentenyl phosphate kinase
VEIGAFLQDNPNQKLVIGHGSGSFGHVPADRHKTREGVASPEAWHGFWEVWYQAALLNSIIRDKLVHQDIPVICFPPSASTETHNGEISQWDLAPLENSLTNGLVPLVYGDVVFDTALGGTILSTEDLFSYLARAMRPQRILLAGIEKGVWADFPARTRILHQIDPNDPRSFPDTLGAAEGFDATGGMSAKVSQMMTLAKDLPGLNVVIFSGGQRATVRAALSGQPAGTWISTKGH